jgi:hypothetical protein
VLRISPSLTAAPHQAHILHTSSTHYAHTQHTSRTLPYSTYKLMTPSTYFARSQSNYFRAHKRDLLQLPDLSNVKWKGDLKEELYRMCKEAVVNYCNWNLYSHILQQLNKNITSLNQPIRIRPGELKPRSSEQDALVLIKARSNPVGMA